MPQSSTGSPVSDDTPNVPHHWYNELVVTGLQTRGHLQTPHDNPQFNYFRGVVPTSTVPMHGTTGGSCDIGKHVELENELQRDSVYLRPLAGANPLRDMEVPLSLRMNYLPHGGWQIPEDISRLKDHTRINIANVARTRPQDKSEYYDQYHRQRVNPHPDHTRPAINSLESMFAVYPA